MSPVVALDYASVAVFALTGALVASRAQLDLVGFVFIACLTAIGGGTVRDALINRDPVFWIGQPAYLALAAAAAIVVFFWAPHLESRYRVLVWLDACALSVAVPAGVGVAMSEGLTWPVVVVMGTLTGCLGGLMRDVVCNEVPLVLKAGEMYVTTAFVGALAAVIMNALHLHGGLLVCAGVTFALRAGSIAFGWSMPVYRPRPPRDGLR